VSADRVDNAEADEDGGGGDGKFFSAGKPLNALVIRKTMTQDERWLARYNEVKNFIEVNHRNPSKYAPEEKLMIHFLKRGRKQINAGELKEPRLGMFMKLLELTEQYRRVNQYA
jgi:hypothetical protein